MIRVSVRRRSVVRVFNRRGGLVRVFVHRRGFVRVFVDDRRVYSSLLLIVLLSSSLGNSLQSSLRNRGLLSRDLIALIFRSKLS